MNQLSPASKIQANLQELFRANISPGTAYIRFKLSQDITALLSMENVQESLIVTAENITPIPNMPSPLIGMMNTRDRVFCIFDMAQLLTLPSPLISSQAYQLIVLEDPISNLFFGFAVPQLLGITRLESETFQMPKLVPSNLLRFIIGSPKDLDQELIILDELEVIKAVSALDSD